jgi:hypothetical protein
VNALTYDLLLLLIAYDGEVYDIAAAAAAADPAPWAPALLLFRTLSAVLLTPS